MRIALAAALLALGCLAGCGGRDDDVARDRGGDTAGHPLPARAPVPSGVVRTEGLAMVLDSGTPVLCLGPVAESAPPQCDGPELVGWDWRRLGRGITQSSGGVRWGSFAVTGTWDGTRFTVSSAIPGALYDPASPRPTAVPSPATSYGDAELGEVAQRLGADLPGALGASAEAGRVAVDVAYDDGTLQDWADVEYGAGVVLVHSALVDVEG